MVIVKNIVVAEKILELINKRTKSFYFGILTFLGRAILLEINIEKKKGWTFSLTQKKILFKIYELERCVLVKIGLLEECWETATSIAIFW